MRTLKKVFVDPDCKHPYLILDCLAKSSTELIGASILSIVRKAARLAVYDDIMISVKNHQKLATVRAEMALQKRYIDVKVGREITFMNFNAAGKACILAKFFKMKLHKRIYAFTSVKSRILVVPKRR